MMLDDLLDPAIQGFIKAHEKADVAGLALKKPPAEHWPYKEILEQIRARQKAASKLPGWAAREDLLFPAPAVVEQASSEATAAFKATLGGGGLAIDLTAGCGADSQALCRSYERVVCIEKDPRTAAALAHNMAVLCPGQVHVLCQSAEEYLQAMPRADLVYCDPQRRDSARRGLSRLEDCSPDILSLLPSLKKNADRILIKASPVLDIDLAAAALGGVETVYVLEWQGECKELLFLLRPSRPAPAEPAIHAVRLGNGGNADFDFGFTRSAERATLSEYALPQAFLYEAGPAFQKAGCFHTLGVRLGLKKLHPHTHLYTSDRRLPDFPGRVFEVIGQYGAHKKELPLRKANVAIRNFPGDVATLRKKLALAEGGDDTLYACTLMDERRVLIHGRRV